ncbi:hypothetical protein DPMN_179050 [Dreissena polymorpha]|uniref:Uncharacterized protein n=1 Tax=Dreissena polymorpha TaxID=45954 RepID=A0A9D4EGE8_DREPO|nr:hypothetical protein DPMN_179050 [Dreissena polymorpha]
MSQPSKPCQREQQAPSALEATGSDTDVVEETAASPQRKRTKPLWMTTDNVTEVELIFEQTI